MKQGNILLEVCLLLSFLGFISADQRNNQLLNIPQTNFRCEDYEWPGYYADVEANCEVFHICVHRPRSFDQFSFLCPNGTAFDQQLLVCSWETSFDCQTTGDFYHINGQIYQTQDVQRTTPEETGGGRNIGGTPPRRDPVEPPKPVSVEPEFDDFDSLVSLRSRNPSQSRRQSSGRELDLSGPKSKSVDGSSQTSFGVPLANQISVNEKQSPVRTSNKLQNQRGSVTFKDSSVSSFQSGRPLPTARESGQSNSRLTTLPNPPTKSTLPPKPQNLSQKPQPPSNSGKPLPTFGQRSRQPQSTSRNPPTVKLNIPSSRPLSAEIVRNQAAKRPPKTSQKKTSVLFINSAEAEKNPEKQQKVYVNTIKLPDNGIQSNTQRTQSKRQRINNSRRQQSLTPSQPEIAVKKAAPTNRQRGRPLTLERFPSSKSFKKTSLPISRSQNTARHRFSAVSLDHSIESGSLGLIASSIFQLPPPGK